MTIAVMGRLKQTACVGGLLAATVLGACTGGASTPVATADRTGTTEAVTTTTSTSAVAASSTTVAVAAVRRPPTTLPPLAAPTTAIAMRPLVVSDVRVGAGTPCEGQNGDLIDSCFWFVYFPSAQRDVAVVLHSDRGYRSPEMRVPESNCDGGPHHSGDKSLCSFYMGGVQGRAEGDRECWWFTTQHANVEPRSNTKCFVWTARYGGTTTTT